MPIGTTHDKLLDLMYGMLMDRKFKEAFPPIKVGWDKLTLRVGSSPNPEDNWMWVYYNDKNIYKSNKKMSKIKNETLKFKKGDKVTIVNDLSRDYLTVNHAYLDDYEDYYYGDNDKTVNYIRKTANIVLSDGKAYRQSSIIPFSQPILDLARSNKRIENRIEKLEEANRRGFFARLFSTKKKSDVNAPISFGVYSR